MKLLIEDIAQRLDEFDEDRLQRTLESDLTVVAPMGSPATTIAELCGAQPPGGVIMVVSKERKPLGILEPKWFLEGLTENGVGARALLDAVRGLENLPSQSRNLLLRGLANYGRRPPPATWCEAGEHFGDGNPCTAHTI